MKRLYIGGLSHTITQKDLKDRFGKFGDVQDVELRTRRDDEGVPYKTFGYINLEITDAGFKKCMTVLNKSKWKGGTIQIEQARETFLQKLAQERHEAAEKIQSPSVNHKDKLVESMKEAGVENFHMKAAVPGTEIPGHKDWVVSKFGRVLPVLNLKCQGRNKLIKYDPSKHSHNIKKLESSAEAPDPTPVSQLTWEISGGDDDISKKRRGEFPPQKTPLAKKKKARPNQVVANGQSDRVKSCGTSEKGSTVLKSNGETRPPTKPKQTPASKKLQTQTSVCVFDSGDDSDGDIRMLAQQSTPVDGPVVDEDEDNLEVVGDNYIPRTFQQKIKNVCQLPGGSSGKNEEDYDSADTDEILNSRKSASGTKQDQLPEVSKTQEKAEVNKQTNNLETDRTKAKKTNKVLPKKAVKKIFPIKKTPSPESDSGDGEDDDSEEEREDSYSSKAKRTYNVLPKKKAIEKSTTPSESDDDDSEEESDSDSSKAQKTGKKVVSKKKTPPSELSSDDSESYEDTSEASADSEYEAMFTNCQRLAFSLDDLQQLVKESFLKGLDRDSDDDDPGSDSQQPGPNRVSEVLEPRASAAEAPVPLAKTGNGNTPQEILAAIFEEDNSDEVREKKKKKKKKTNPSTSLPAFQGTKALLATSPQSLKRQVEEDGETETSTKKQKRDRLVTITKPSASEDDAKAVSKPSDIKGTETKTRPPNRSDREVTTESPALRRKTTSKAEAEKKSVPAASSTSCSSGCSSVESEMEEDVPAKKTQKAEVSKKAQTAAAKQQDNQKRLAAQEQRQKEAELQKKLIQEALAKLDSAADGKHHIKFSSDEEEDGDEEEHTSPVPPNPKKTLFQNSQSDEEDSSDEESPARGKPGLKDTEYRKLAGSNLFDDDDDDDDDEEKDGDRFQIKPQFEGKAGAKLMQLQSRFGTDERFQMDHRFVDSDDADNEPEMEASQPERECELVEEKKKSLDILNHLLHINVQPSDPNKPTAKGKTFRDISALQYDPTKEEHAAFETKNDKPKKDSKLARKKKREEAEKLPEVSREMYYDVSMDLKEVFGTSKEEKTEEEENVAWDKEEEETSQPMAVDPVMVSSHLSTNEGEASSGFKFSFFGDDTAADTTTGKEEYRIETLKGAKVSWQVDPRFQDSSDEEEEEEEEEAKEQTDTTTPTEEPLASKKAFFFFRLDDERLKEGPKAFCRSSKLEDQREMWEEKRTGLIEEYRKKHKDARRKLKTSQRN